jgi:probable F420-dependent oxidoreductase
VGDGPAQGRSVRLGIITPVLTLTPGGHAGWEREGTLDDVVRIAQAADRLGYDHLTCSEHVAVPQSAVEQRGGRYWDPLATFGFLAAHTERIRLATYVLVLGYHHPLEIAKRYGTLDRVSGGRLVLGVGVGSLEEEFDLLGVPFDDRGARADDSLRALRAALSDPLPSHDGPYYRFSGMVVDPCAVQEHVPIWIGGRTARSLKRAVALADGWCPFWLNAQRAKAMVAEVTASEAWERRDRPFDIALQPTRPVDPLDAPDQALATFIELVDAGATTIDLALVHRSPAHYIEQLEAAAEIAAGLGHML